jgi:hypothetical protein
MQGVGPGGGSTVHLLYKVMHQESHSRKLRGTESLARARWGSTDTHGYSGLLTDSNWLGATGQWKPQVQQGCREMLGGLASTKCGLDEESGPFLSGCAEANLPSLGGQVCRNAIW